MEKARPRSKPAVAPAAAAGKEHARKEKQRMDSWFERLKFHWRRP
jgi:hypothetical protein